MADPRADTPWSRRRGRLGRSSCWDADVPAQDEESEGRRLDPSVVGDTLCARWIYCAVVFEINIEKPMGFC